MEIFKSIIDNEDYLISNYGRVISLKWGRIKTLKPQIVEHYNLVRLSKGKNRKQEYIHRLVAIHFIDNPKNYLEINHKDGNKLNNHYSNLEWCDRQLNITHARINGLDKRINRLTIEDIENIRTLFKIGYKRAAICKRYKMSYSAICQIILGKTWAHI